MKKITFLLITVFYSLVGYCQFPQNFDDITPYPGGLPTGWMIADNDVGTNQSWRLTNQPPPYVNGTQAMLINLDDIGQGNTSIDYLITHKFEVPANGQLRFFAHQQASGNQGSIYEVRYSTSLDQGELSSYQLLQSWTEPEMNSVYNVFEEKVVDLTPAVASGTMIYIAFVRINSQEGPGQEGDRWIIDDVNVVEKCLEPTDLAANDIAATTATLVWNHAGTPTDFDYQILLATDPTPEIFSPVPTVGTDPLAEPVSGLIENTDYKYFVRANCGGGNYSEWAGPFYFSTIPLGAICSDPIEITTLPYETDANTGSFGNSIAGPQAAGCGAVPASTNFLSGNDVIYKLEAPQDGIISITLTPNGTRSSVFVYAECEDISGPCLAGVANTNGNPRIIDNFSVVEGEDYYIVISSNVTTPTVPYNLIIQYENCEKPTTLGFDTPTVTGGNFTWTEAGTATAWQIEVQDAGDTIPAGDGTYAAAGTPSLNIANLPVDQQGVPLQFWVRSECAPGVYSAWAGPFFFNTLICDAANQCTYTFRMTDSANNGWNGARMQIRQNGIILTNSTGETTIGGNYPSGAGPVDVTVTLCDDSPFDIFWLTPGTQPQQCILTILNSFGQTIYTKAAGEGIPGEIIYNGVVECDTPQCDIAPTNVTVDPITTTGGTINWTAPGTENVGFEIYLVPTGSPAPTADTAPTFAGMNGPAAPFSFVIPIDFPFEPLLADNTYDVYVRVVCEPEDSPWSIVKTFTTLPTCPKPINQLVSGITTAGAVLNWTEAALATEWEVLLLPSGPEGQAPDAPGVVIPADTEHYYPGLTVTTLSPVLTPATIYYYYVRAVCGGNDPSTWTGPFIFNTITCEDSEKCQYKLVLTDTGGNGWNGARLQVRQNGIIQTAHANIGSNFNSGSGPITVNIMLCDDVPFDVYWSVPGSAPNEIGFTIQNPFTDIIYTYEPGTGTPLTMLYDDNILGNCTPPTCPKPTALTVVNTTQTTAELSWTPGGTEQQWEIYAVPVGTAPPVNYTDLNAGLPYYLTPANGVPSYTITEGLVPGTAYVYYVRGICSPTDISTWTILAPKIFYTKPVNDECSAAIVAPVNPTRECAAFVSGNTLGATASAQASTCPGAEDDDVWFEFIATNDIHIISLTNVVGSSTDINHALYVGDECDTLTQLYCSNNATNTSIANNLTEGTLYKIRVYTNGTSPANGNNPVHAAFDLCIITPAPITNDECTTAIVAPVNAGIDCDVTIAGSITGATPSPESSTCAGTEDDDVWFEFTATSPKHVITLQNVVGSIESDLNHSLYEGDECGNLTFKYCSTPDQSIADNLTIGTVYKIRIWSASSQIQDILFDLCIASIVPPITVSTTQYTKEELVTDILIKSECATVTNIAWSTGTGASNGIGYFNKSLSQFAFEDGIVLVSGSATSVVGPNTNIISGGGLGGDADLSAILAAQTPPVTGTLNNATSLEFDFVAIDPKIDFQFMFASEEYGVFQCGFSDAFAFILTNVTDGTAPVNLAVIPDTSIPVTVYNIRDMQYNGGCVSSYSELFGSFYDNPAGQLGAPINLNGITVPLVASSIVIPGKTYHIKMVIADINDSSYDSAVFLKGGSFNIGNITLPEDYLIADGTALCKGDDVLLDSELNPELYDIQWFIETAPGVKEEIPNATTPILTVSESGTYIIEAAYTNTDCVTSDSIVVEYFIDADAGTPQDLVLCDASGNGVFDLTSNATTILAPFAEGTHELVYFLTLEDAENNVIENAIALEDLEEFAGTNGQVIYVRVNYLGTSCFQVVDFTLVVEDLTPQFTLLGTQQICPEGTTTITVSPANNNFTYSWTFGGAPLAETSGSLTINGEAGYGTYTVTVDNAGCASTQTFEITNANTTWFFDLTAPADLCPDETGTLSANVTNNPLGLPVTYTYTLTDGSEVVQTTNSITIDTPGTYSVMVDIQGCISGPETITVGESVADWQIAFVGEPFVICPTQSTTLSFTATNFDLNDPNAIYTWITPSGVEAQGPTFAATEVGTYTLEVDILGCVSSFETEVEENTTAIDVDFEQGCEGSNYLLVANPSSGSFDPLTSSYAWSSANGVFENTADAHVIVVKGPGAYTVTITTADGCVVSETISVNSISCQIQRGISPNNNGENDKFDLSMYNVQELNIFNRYGTEVYNFRNYVDQWSGQSNSGDELPDGTYFYVIHTQEGENITGWIYINR